MFEISSHRLESSSPSFAKLGEVMGLGFVQVPNVLLFQQSSLGLNAVDTMVLVNLMLHWREVDEPVFPSTELISKRMGIKRRTVQNSIRKLIQMQFIEKISSSSSKRGAGARSYDLRPLKLKLSQYVSDKVYQASKQESER